MKKQKSECDKAWFETELNAEFSGLSFWKRVHLSWVLGDELELRDKRLLQRGDKKSSKCQEKQRGWREQGMFQWLCLVQLGGEAAGKSPLWKPYTSYILLRPLANCCATKSGKSWVLAKGYLRGHTHAFPGPDFFSFLNFAIVFIVNVTVLHCHKLQNEGGRHELVNGKGL